MTFQGFGADALPFFKALAFHQSREWFEANRETYERALVDAVADRVRPARRAGLQALAEAA